MRKILLIDDDEELCQEIKEILVSEGFEVNAVYNGLDALLALQNQEFGLLLLDLKLPGIDGVKLLRQVKESDPSQKVIILSGSPVIQRIIRKNTACQSDEEAMIQKFADAVVAKPCDPGLLLKKIYKLI